MPRATLPVGTFVEFSPRAGLVAARQHQLSERHVMKIDAVIPVQVYGRRAYAVSCGPERLILWPSHVRKVRHPKMKIKRKVIA